MGPRYLCRVWIVALLLGMLPWQYQCVSVYFRYQEPLHVIAGKTLVLEALVEQNSAGQIDKVVWERGPESGARGEKVKVANFPGKEVFSHISTESQGLTLKVMDFGRGDSGVYTVTVTDRAQAVSNASCIVNEYVAVHHVSVSVNLSHSTLSCAEAWGTDPSFSWLHEQVTVTQEVGRVSADGKTLHLSAQPCGHFVCVVTNLLGHSSATYTAEPCESPASGGTAVAVVFMVILLICGSALAFYLWRDSYCKRCWSTIRRGRGHKNRGERLCEPYEEHL